MILSDRSIKAYIRTGELIKPVNKKLTIEKFLEAVGPASFDCRIGDEFKVPESNNVITRHPQSRIAKPIIDISKEIKYNSVIAKEYIIHPKSFVLATTEEYLKLPRDISGYVEGRSSIGRVGLFVQNAGYIDPGFEGQITLELFNANDYPVKIYAGRRMCQIVFFKLDKACDKPYNGKYKKQGSTTGSRVHLDRD